MHYRYQKYLFYTLCLYFISNGYAIDLYNAEIKDGQTIALYPGTFDPIHLGHDEVIRYTLSHTVANHVIVMPRSEFNSYKPHMTDIQPRNDLLNFLYEAEAHIIVTALDYKDLLDYLLKKFKNITLIAVFGSDNYLRHIQENTLPKERGDSYLIIPREKDKNDSLLRQNNLFDGKPVVIANTEHLQHQGYSSTQVRKFLQSHPEFYSGLINPSLSELPIEPRTRDFIRESKLYQKVQ